MSEATQENKDGGGPEVIRFKARLVRQAAAAKNGPPMRVEVPKAVNKKLRGMSKVEGTMNGHPFRAALEAGTSGGWWLKVNEAMRRGAKAEAGDTVQLAILAPEPAPKIPADLRAAFTASPEAKAFWEELTTMGRRDWVRWIEGAKQSETRARRVRRTVEQLSVGKRRPCCVNVYEFMLCRVQE